jgi:hypothetical protein
MTPPAAPLRVGSVDPSPRAKWRSITQHCLIIFNTWAYVATFVPSQPSFHRHFDGGSTKLVRVLD